MVNYGQPSIISIDFDCLIDAVRLLWSLDVDQHIFLTSWSYPKIDNGSSIDFVHFLNPSIGQRIRAIFTSNDQVSELVGGLIEDGEPYEWMNGRTVGRTYSERTDLTLYMQ